MLTREDCVALSDPTEEEIQAIAAHEHIPLLAAGELGHYRVRGDRRQALKLEAALRRFVEQHRPVYAAAGCCCH